MDKSIHIIKCDHVTGLCTHACRFVLCSTFYGVTFALGDSLGGNRYVNFFFGVSVEAPAVFLSLFIADR